MEIRNYGICGANSRQIIDGSFDEVEKFKPTLAIVLAGANDCGNVNALLPPAAFRKNYREMMSRLNALGARIITLTIAPLMDRAFKHSFGEKPFSGFMPNERVQLMNAIIWEEAAAAGASVIDLYSVFAETDLESVHGFIRHRRNYQGVDDGCHPTRSGYRKMARLIYDRIRALNADTTRIACIGDSITYGAYTPGEGKAELNGLNYPGLLNRMLNPVDEPAKPVADFIKKGVIYQVSMRAFSKEGNFAAITSRMKEIAATGATILYLLPFVESDPDMDRNHWSQRQKASGCDNPRNPYRISDFFKVDPEFGTEEDLKALVAAAHANGMKIIADLVYFHAGPTFAVRHPTFVVRNPDGTPADGAWAFPKLEFANPELREYLWQNMEHFIRDFDFDGYRCDVGAQIPLDFWEEGRRRIEKIKPDVIMLDEGIREDDHRAAFDIDYCWENAFLQEVLQGDATAEEFALQLQEVTDKALKGALFLRNYDNHDISNDQYEERFERRYGPRAVDMLLTYCYTHHGVPFIYCGCEFNDGARHSIFGNKGQYVIDRGGDHRQRLALLQKLAKIHSEIPAFYDGSLAYIHTNYPKEIFSYIREANGERYYVAMNFTTHPVRFLPEIDTFAPAGEPLLAARAKVIDNEIEIGSYGFIITRI